MKRVALILLAITSLAVPAFAQQMPPGKWWRRPEVANELHLTADQQSRLDAIFRSAADALIYQRGETEKLGIALRGELDQEQLNKANVLRLAQRLGEARAKLFEREVMMLVDMRGVLNDDQWARLREHLDRPRQQMQQDNPRRKQMQ